MEHPRFPGLQAVALPPVDFDWLARRAKWIHRYGALILGIMIFVTLPILAAFQGAAICIPIEPHTPEIGAVIGGFFGLILGTVIALPYAAVTIFLVRLNTTVILCITKIEENTRKPS